MGSLSRAFWIRRQRLTGAAACLLTGLLAGLLTGCGSPSPGPADPDFRVEDCAAHRLADEHGRSIIGIEDIAALPRHGMLILSAYDRRATAHALRDGTPLPASGGLYLLDLGKAWRKGGKWRALRLKGATIRRPHGITAIEEEEADTPRLFVIARRYRDGTLEADIRQMRLDLRTGRLIAVKVLAQGPAWCAANDLAFDDTAPALLVTLDHAACHGPARWWEDLTAAASGRLVRIDLGKDALAPLTTPDAAHTISNSLVWPNGIAIARDRVWVAETRGQRLRTLDSHDLVPRAITALSGAPDNLSLLPPADDGDDRAALGLLVAVHDSLWRLALFRDHLFGVRRAKSRIIRLDDDGHAFELLVDDGSRLSAATTALAIDKHLIAASAWDDRLLVCRFIARKDEERRT